MVAMKDIRAFARRLATDFKPRRIILFGSYAHGNPRRDSDVDLLVEMPYRGHPVRRAIEILRRLDPRFGLDLIVCSPQEVRRRLAQHDWFLMDAIEKGRLLYEARDARVG